MALAAEFGFDRLHAHAVGFGGAVAATFADILVDEHALVGVGKLALLTAATLFGGASLVVDDRGNTRNLLQLPLGFFQQIAMANFRACRPAHVIRILVRLVGDDDDFLDAFPIQLVGHHLDVQFAVHRLAAGHGGGVVVQQLVRDIGLGTDRGANRQDARVEISAVAQVLERVRHIDEVLHADP